MDGTQKNMYCIQLGWVDHTNKGQNKLETQCCQSPLWRWHKMIIKYLKELNSLTAFLSCLRIHYFLALETSISKYPTSDILKKIVNSYYSPSYLQQNDQKLPETLMHLLHFYHFSFTYVLFSVLST